MTDVFICDAEMLKSLTTFDVLGGADASANHVARAPT